VGTIQLGVIGSTGRMGGALRAYLEGVDDVFLCATLNSGGSIAALLAAMPEVVVDLSTGPALDEHGVAVVDAGIPYVIGATGYGEGTLERLREASDRSGAPVLVVPNFSLGANLMIKFAAAASRLMQAPVITERHHMGKADAPSGTAVFTARRIAEARGGMDIGRDSTARHFAEHLPHVLGGELEGVAIHSLRGDGYLAEQSVQLSLTGESLSIEHRSIDRRCFMPGIIYAVRNIGRVSGLQIGLDTIVEV
jgi:4-hydroxy-tetrahydrodipicolinate reductase